MRRTVGVLTIVAAASLAGCGEAENPFPGSEGAGPGGGGRLFYAIEGDPGSLDPLRAASFSARVVARQLFEPLAGRLRSPFGGPSRPALALGFAHSRDLRVWSLRLRRGMRFGDGTPLDASAVAANAERWRADPTGRALLPSLLAAAAPRPGLVRLIFSRPVRGLRAMLGDSRLGIVSPMALRLGGEPDAAFLGARKAGSGPFELRGKVAGVAVLDRNRQWWGSSLGLGPSLERVVFRVAAPEHGRVALLRSGAVRVASGLRPETAGWLARDPLLATVGAAGASGAIAFERSVRGIDRPGPIPLAGVWLALLRGGG